MEKKDIEYTLNEEHLKKFETFGRYYETLFGLSDWGIYYRLPSCDEDREHIVGNKAFVCSDRIGMTASIVLSPVWPLTEPTDENLRDSALHEVLHLVLIPLNSLATYRFSVNEEDIGTEVHRIIRKIAWAITKTTGEIL